MELIYVFTFDLHNNSVRLADFSCNMSWDEKGAYFIGNKTIVWEE